MGRRDLHEPGPELGIDRLVRDDGDGDVRDREPGALADEARVPLVARLHGDRGVAHQRLRSRGRDRGARLRARLHRAPDAVLLRCPAASRPRIRSKRISTSWITLLSPCPMCSTAVTLGGGITMTYGSLGESAWPVNAPLSSQRW